MNVCKILYNFNNYIIIGQVGFSNLEGIPILRNERPIAFLEFSEEFT